MTPMSILTRYTCLKRIIKMSSKSPGLGAMGAVPGGVGSGVLRRQNGPRAGAREARGVRSREQSRGHRKEQEGVTLGEGGRMWKGR